MVGRVGGVTDEATHVHDGDGPGGATTDDGPEVGSDVGAMAAHLRIIATRLARLLRRQGDTGLSPSQLSALTSIERRGPLTLGALADHEQVAPPSITKVVASGPAWRRRSTSSTS